MWLVLAPVAAFLTAFCAGGIALRYFFKRAKFSHSQTASGDAIRIDGPFVSVNVYPEGTLDPRLAEIPLYPGAMSTHPASAEVITELDLGGRKACDISATYWTPDPVAEVWDFYRKNLPQWPRNMVQARGKELIQSSADCVRLIRITRGRENRTIVELSIKPPEYPYVFGSSY